MLVLQRKQLLCRVVAAQMLHELEVHAGVLQGEAHLVHLLPGCDSGLFALLPDPRVDDQQLRRADLRLFDGEVDGCAARRGGGETDEDSHAALL